MSSNTENIEAKLCAYVEGDLDEQGKLEIEKHLQANPQHRLLLEELKQTKVMLQALPREVAPPELAETIHGQLERSVLLDGVGTDDVAATMKINRWPQLMAVAAVLILAAGLGVLVYVVLPRHSDTIAFDPAASLRSESTAESKPSAAKPTEEIGPVASKDAGDARFPEGPERIAAAAETEKERSAKAESVLGEPSLSLNSSKTDGGLAKTGDAPVPTPGVPATPAIPARRVLVVLKTDNVAETNGQVASYLATNRITWSAVEPTERESVLGVRFFRDSAKDRPGEGDVTLGGIVAAPPVNSPDTFNTTTGVAGQNAVNDGDTTRPAGKVAMKGGDGPRDAYQMTQRGRAGNDMLHSQVPLPAMDQAQQVSSATTQPQENEQVATQQKQVPSQVMSPQMAKVLEDTDRRFGFETTSNENVIVARNLTRDQAVMVVDSLGKLYAGQTAVVLDRDVLDVVPARQLPRADEVFSATTQPAATQPAGETREGQTGWSQAGTVDALKSPASPTQAASTTQPAGTAPPVPELAVGTTRPSDALGGGVSQPVFSAKQAEELDLKQQAVTTQPAELPVEVVIVVQPVAAAPVDAAETPPNPGTLEVPGNPEPAVAATPAPTPATQPTGVEPAPEDMKEQAK